MVENGAAFLSQNEQDAVARAKESLATRGKAVTEPFLVAELSFGFWTSLLDVRYDKMWPKIIAGVFPHMPRTIRTRKEVSPRMNIVRRLRNAAVHHHSIWHWHDLASQHAQVRTLFGWVCDTGERMAAGIDRFPKVHADGSQQFHELASKFSQP